MKIERSALWRAKALKPTLTFYKRRILLQILKILLVPPTSYLNEVDKESS